VCVCVCVCACARTWRCVIQEKVLYFMLWFWSWGNHAKEEVLMNEMNCIMSNLSLFQTDGNKRIDFGWGHWIKIFVRLTCVRESLVWEMEQDSWLCFSLPLHLHFLQFYFKVVVHNPDYSWNHHITLKDCWYSSCTPQRFWFEFWSQYFLKALNRF